MHRILILGLCALLLLGCPCLALNFYSTGDASFNTTAPAGLLADSGWQWQGEWGADLGTPIAPNYFITAAHIGGSVGDTFTYSGTAYTTTAMYSDPNSDLRIFKVSGTFSSYAQIYTGSSEVGQSVVLFGRGAQRGDAVVLNGATKGWQWGTSDAVMRWGENTIGAIYNGGSTYGSSLLGMSFSGTGGVNEAGYSMGDSGGGVFVLDNGVWKLAGINSWADGPYGTSSTPYEGAFDASLFDQSGYYGDTLNGWEQVSGPSISYATRVSTSQGWIASVVPEPGTCILLSLGGLFLALRRRRRIPA